MKTTWNALKVLFSIATWIVTFLCWLLFGTWTLATLISDWRAARRTRADGHLRCLAGHIIEPSGVFECSGCGWVFRSDNYGLNCPNPECPKPQSNIVNCTTCGLSVRNPGRIGRP